MDDREKKARKAEYNRRYKRKPEVKERIAKYNQEYNQRYFSKPEVKEREKRRKAQYYQENKRKINESNAEWRRNNQDKARAISHRAQRKYSSWYYELKATKTCAVCGESRPPCLDFHHRDPTQKLFNIARAAHRIGSEVRTKEEILAEIEKCDVLCKNCHAVLHWGE